MDHTYNCFGTCRALEVDYDKKEIRAKTKDYWGEHVVSRDFGMITHYEFEYVKKERADSTPEDSDSRDHLIQLRETMCVGGLCEEIGDFSTEEERLATLLHYEVGLKLWYFYYQNSEVKKSSLYFPDGEAFEARRRLKSLIKYLNGSGQTDRNIFVGTEHLRIGDIVSLGIPFLEFEKAVSGWRKRENVANPNIVLPKFGECILEDIGSQENVGHVNLRTTRRMTEDEVLPLFEYMKESMPVGASYDDGGYGVPAPPHRINHFWPLSQGEVYMRWHGLDFKFDEGLDDLRIELWEQSWLNEIRGEEYWRSEVD